MLAKVPMMTSRSRKRIRTWMKLSWRGMSGADGTFGARDSELSK
jgi:hypothetical protein